MTLLLALLAQNWKAVLGGAVGIALGLGLAQVTTVPLAHHRGFQDGQQAMAQAVEKQNAAAAEAAGRARGTINDCFARGGEWDQETGKCDR